MAAATAAPHDRDLVWRRQLVFWHATFGVLFVVTLYLTVMDDRGLRLAGAACVAGIGIAYAVWGARACSSRTADSGRSTSRWPGRCSSCSSR